MTGGKPPQHVLADWLKLHEVSAEQCLAILQAWPAPRQPEPKGAQISDLSADAAWDMAAAALTAVFGMSAHMEKVRRQTRCEFQPPPGKYPRAFTLKGRGQGAPVVVCNYRGFVADIMVLAHEFGHASQIVASGADFVAPVPREVCAFLAELAMLEYLQCHLPDLHRGAQQVWQTAVANTWRKDRHDLMQVLADPDGLSQPYNYQWNYPLARVLAQNLWGNVAADQAGRAALWPLFEGRMGITQLRDI